MPTNIRLESLTGWNQSDSVLLGVVAGTELVELYNAHGDALFFENIRDYLGISSGKVVSARSTVNSEIIQTIKSEPEKMLARNNGITFRTERVEVNGNVVHLSIGAIVNGCQTTMCLVQCSPVAPACRIQVKIVKTDDAWDIAKSANYQNSVARIDLDLARYLRPQLVRRVATSLGYAMDTETGLTASAVLNAVHRNRVDYEELKLLYLGLFSRRPSNLFQPNYSELLGDALEGLMQSMGEEEIFPTLLLILTRSREALGRCEEIYSDPEYASFFKRFYHDGKPRYRVYLAALALCGLLKDDISVRHESPETEAQRMVDFLKGARRKLENQPEEYLDAYELTFQTIAELLLDIPAGKSEAEIAQSMYKRISGTAFTSHYKKLLMKLDSARSRNERAESTKRGS